MRPNTQYTTPQLRARAHLDNPCAVVLDTETTGLGSDAEIVEIAIIDLDGNVLLDTLIRPTCPIPPDAVAIHGITDNDVAGAPFFHELWPTLKTIFAGKFVYTYNRDFDIRLLSQSAEACNLFEPMPLEGDCIMQLAADYLLSRRWLKLERAADQLGVPVQSPQHRALGDARTALAILRAIADTGEPDEHST